MKPAARAAIMAITLPALLGVMAGAGAGAISPAARAVVDRYVEATGGRTAFLADTALHVRGRVLEEGMRGTYERWWRSPDQLLEIANMGSVRFRRGFDGQAGWRTDYNSRKVAPLEGKDLESIRSEAWFAGERWALDDQGGGTVTLGQNSYYKGRSLVALEVTPPVGPGKSLWFDAETGLLARMTHRRDQYTWNEEVAKWKPLAGRRRWTVSVQGDSVMFPQGYGRSDVDSVRIEAPRDAAAFSPPNNALRPVTWLRARGVAKLPFRYRRGHVWVRASIDGAAPADFILDTGCTMSAIDKAHARAIGLETDGHMTVSGVGGEDTGGWAQVRSLRVASATGDGVDVPDLKVAVIELNDDMEKLDWDDAAGLIGYDFLSRFVVTFDFDEQVVTLRDPAAFDPAGAGEAVPFTLHACIPTVEVRLNGDCSGRFIVDVGNATVMQVNSDQVDRCRLFGGPRKEVQHWVGGIGGAFPETVCRLDSIQLGPFTWREPVAGLTLHHLGSAGSKDIQGNIGTSVLERFRCTFDYAHGTLYLAPGKRFALRDHYSRSGLYVVRWSGRVVVAAVVRHSPGADAGLKVRDVLKAVNGRPIEQWTPEALQALFERGAVGTTVMVKVERELEDQDIELTLAEVL